MPASSRRAAAIAAALWLALTACQKADGATAKLDEGVRGESSPQGEAGPARADSAQIAAALGEALSRSRPTWLRRDQWAIVERVYRRDSAAAAPAPLWLESGRLARRAGDFAAVLATVRSLGLEPGDYGIKSLGDALSAAKSPPEGTAAAALANADLLLTASFVALVDDLLTGRLDPREVEPSWHIASRTFDVGRRIASALDSVRGGENVRDVLAGLRPDYGSYGALLQALARYRALESSGGWSPVSTGPTLRTGDAGAAVVELRRRLAAEGLASPTGSDSTFDADLAAMVARFQERHGLAVDSAVGPRTRAALDIPVTARVRQIEANLERLRWLPVDPGERFIVVNVPAFVLYAFTGTKRELTMRVVVGDELTSRRTPIFADTMEYIQFGPYWNVPRSIAVNEIFPKARADRGYLARNNYEILRGWGDNAPVVNPRSLSNTELFSARYRVRQKPGPDNALGRVKFMFPNDYAVYLHDTPSRSRFEQSDRAASHGCVRVADPEALADFVLQDRADWPREKIATTLASGRRVRVNLQDRGPPVYLIYLTAYGRDGEVFFRDDIYDRDGRLVRAIAARHAPSP